MKKANGTGTGTGRAVLVTCDTHASGCGVSRLNSYSIASGIDDAIHASRPRGDREPVREYLTRAADAYETLREYATRYQCLHALTARAAHAHSRVSREIARECGITFP